MTDRDTYSFGIVVPCYNEALRFKAADFIAFSRNNPEFDFLFVDDGSTDDTRTILNNICRQNPVHFSQLNLDTNSGKANAVRLGLLRIRESKSYLYCGFIDADLAIPLEHLLKMREAAVESKNTDLILSSRYLHQVIQHSSPIRHFLSRKYNQLMNWLIPASFHFTDTQCGCKLIRTEILSPLTSKPFISSWLFDTEMIFRLCRLKENPQFMEIQLTSLNDNRGSKIRKRDSVRLILDSFRILFHYRFKA